MGTALASALMLAAGVAVCTAATVATGGLALAVAGFALGGASVGVSMATSGMVESDRETGYVRSSEEFWAGIFTGAIAGGIAGASLYGTVAIAPTMGTLAGMSAEYYLGVSSFTQNTVPAIMTTGMNGLAAATGLYTANDIYASNGGYNIILDKVFDNNVDKYEECGILLYMLTDMAGEYVTMNSFRLGTGRGVQFEKGDEESIDSNNPFYKKGGGSDLDDFMTPHAEKHAYNSDVKSTRNKTQFGKNINVAKLREDTLLYPDEVIYDSEHNTIKYVKEYDFNISTSDTPTGKHRVFINLSPKAGKTNRNSQFPYYGGNK